MKYLSMYKELLACESNEELFVKLLSTLKPSILVWSYFVNWEKVVKNVENIEMELNTLNYLIGKESFYEEFINLITKHPEVVRIIPALIVRDGTGEIKFNILVDYKNKKLKYENYDFDKSEITQNDIEKYYKFIKETGLEKLLQNKRIKNLVDYMYGVEAGLDSNGRKNRCGTQMETILEYFIKDICERNKFRYLTQANASAINNSFGIKVPIDKVSRRFDFVIHNNKRLYFIEANFYSGGGSKLKSTAGEYKDLYNVLKRDGDFPFIWITDGKGWNKTVAPLRETFEHNDYLLNLYMVEEGILERIVTNNE